MKKYIFMVSGISYANEEEIHSGGKWFRSVLKCGKKNLSCTDIKEMEKKLEETENVYKRVILNISLIGTEKIPIFQLLQKEFYKDLLQFDLFERRNYDFRRTNKKI
ncbi:hypothetical protein A2U09_07625 [Fusobacterium necrophorum subsp. funduliforme]|uniref:hypothetical protein n=1 Tax=Fusobacterium necrophorum TaxID=859 RepID=UPI0007892951|nr:hypothetical protein [Fusobacterium necrophorum]KYM58519.1 hypothetical protein A2U09_07625 [Fusobacterium necrophorum subsp. funduliforme]